MTTNVHQLRPPTPIEPAERLARMVNTYRARTVPEFLNELGRLDTADVVDCLYLAVRYISNTIERHPDLLDPDAS
jgi:hypothetical protein